jgi:hypothetical protein
MTEGLPKNSTEELPKRNGTPNCRNLSTNRIRSVPFFQGAIHVGTNFRLFYRVVRLFMIFEAVGTRNEIVGETDTHTQYERCVFGCQKSVPNHFFPLGMSS